MITWMKKVNNFKFSLRMLLSFCLIFRQFQPALPIKVLLLKESVQ